MKEEKYEKEILDKYERIKEEYIRKGLIVKATNDRVFKALMKDAVKFRSKLISEITGISYEFLLENTVFEDTELEIEDNFEKLKRTDILLRTATNQIILEMNESYNKDIFDKNLSYAFKVSNASVMSGELWRDRKKVILINFDNFDYYKGCDTVLDFKLYNEKNKIIENEKFIVYHVNLAKVNNMLYNDFNELRELDKMLLVFNINNKKKLESIAKGDEYLMDAKDKINKLMDCAVFVGEYETEEMRVKRQKRDVEDAREEGIREKAIDTAKKMLKRDYNIDDIVELTGLTKEQIEKL